MQIGKCSITNGNHKPLVNHRNNVVDLVHPDTGWYPVYGDYNVYLCVHCGLAYLDIDSDNEKAYIEFKRQQGEDTQFGEPLEA